MNTSSDKFLAPNHSINFYVKKLAQMGCPVELLQAISDLKGKNSKIQSEDLVEQQIVRSSDSEFYYYECGDWGYNRVHIDASIGYIDFGYQCN